MRDHPLHFTLYVASYMRQDQCGFSNKPQEHNTCVEKLKHAQFEITDQKAFAASYFLSKIYQNHLR